jgi:hypothetical protein
MRRVIWLQTPTVFLLGGGIISLLLIGHRVFDVRWTETNTEQPLVPEPSAYNVEMVTEKLKRHRSSGSDNSSRIH